MKIQKRIILSSLICASVLTACSSVPANNATPAPSANASAQAATPDPQADLKIAVTRISAKAFNNKAFSEELQANPKAVLKAEGLTLPDSETVKVLNFLNEEGKVYLILDDRNLEFFYSEQIKNSPSDADTDENLKILRSIRSKAQSDVSFKARLLSDPAAVLAAEGINAEASKNFEILDFAPDTHYFLVLPPDQQVTRGVGAESFSTLIDAKSYILLGISSSAGMRLKDVVDTIDGRRSQFLEKFIFIAPFESEIGITYATIESICFFPRIFGQACGASTEQIREKIRNFFVVRYMDYCINKIQVLLPMEERKKVCEDSIRFK